MKPIRSYEAICKDYGLNTLQADLLQSLVHRHRGVLHPYWIQIALYVQYDFAARLHDEIIKNEWAIPDRELVGGIDYESALTDGEIDAIAWIELGKA